MNAHSRDKSTAWEFIEWATGKSLLLRSAFEGNMNPTRASTWEDSSFQERAAHWGDFAGVARRLVEDVSDVLVTPAVNYIDVARRWTRALRDAFAGTDSLENCLSIAASDMERLVAR
jgi:multiple sugar transport system substrate-binding protein